MLNDSGKSLFKPWISVQNVLLLSAVIFLIALSNLTSSELASWVQAVGSIAAIWGAFTLSNNQLKRQEEQKNLALHQRSKAFYAVVKHAVDHAKDLKVELVETEGQKNLKQAWVSGYDEIFKAAVKSLSLIPAFELGDYDLVIAHNHILAAMINISQKIEEFARLEEISEQDAQVFQLQLSGHLLFIDHFWPVFEKIHATP